MKTAKPATVRVAAPFSAGTWTYEPTGESFDASVLNGIAEYFATQRVAEAMAAPGDGAEA